jgi:hypothetical protein
VGGLKVDTECFRGRRGEEGGGAGAQQQTGEGAVQLEAVGG